MPCIISLTWLPGERKRGRVLGELKQSDYVLNGGRREGKKERRERRKGEKEVELGRHLALACVDFPLSSLASNEVTEIALSLADLIALLLANKEHSRRSSRNPSCCANLPTLTPTRSFRNRPPFSFGLRLGMLRF